MEFERCGFLDCSVFCVIKERDVKVVYNLICAKVISTLLTLQ
jgi:hypothetical protein